MATATLSTKYQLALPKAVREQMKLKAGQKFTVIAKGDVINLVPQRTLEWARGKMAGANPKGYRDRRDRI